MKIKWTNKQLIRYTHRYKIKTHTYRNINIKIPTYLHSIQNEKCDKWASTYNHFNFLPVSVVALNTFSCYV